MNLLRSVYPTIIYSFVAVALSGGSCGQRGDKTSSVQFDSIAGTDLVRVDIDKRDPERLLRFYLNSFVADGVSALEVSNGKFFVNLAAINSGGAPTLRDTNDDGVITWEELEPFVLSEYYERRHIPESVDSLRETVGDWYNSDRWFRFAVNGVMTSARRDIYVPKESILSAIESFDSDSGLVYPHMTLFVAEHYSDHILSETTVMMKRHDGLWDFAAFDSVGHRTTVTRSAPKAYNVPTQCVGCHYGSRGFEPERSFPRAAKPGPGGERVVHYPDVAVTSALVSRFDEHMKRSDTVLGLYATLFVATLRDLREAELTEREKRALEYEQ